MPETTIAQETTAAEVAAPSKPSRKASREPAHRKSQTAKALEAAANAAEVKAKKEKAILTPAQILSQLAEKMPNRTEVTSIGQELMEAFSDVSESKIDCGRLLDKAQSAWGENWPSFRDKFIVASLRKSVDTISNYIALYRAFSLEFARTSAEFRHALRRIWSAERCFDTTNGELKPVVREAIAAIGGMDALTKATSGEECAVLAEKFVGICDTLNRNKRQGARQWTAEKMTEKKIAIVKALGVIGEKTSGEFLAKVFHDLCYKALALLGDDAVEKIFNTAMEEYIVAREKAAKQHVAETAKKAA